MKTKIENLLNEYVVDKVGASCPYIDADMVSSIADEIVKLLNLHDVTNSLPKKTNGLSLVPDAGRFARDILDNYETMGDDVKQTLLINIAGICENARQ